MRVFVTGATGFVGSVVVRDLIAGGHQVLGLTRSDAGATALVQAGAQVHRASLDDLDSLGEAASSADGVIHTAFNHDFSRFVQSCEEDKHVIETLGAALIGSRRPLLVTSGVAFLAAGRTATEDDAAPPVSSHYPRASEAAAGALVEKGVRAAVVRLSPSVHGTGDHGFIPFLIGLARERGVSAMIGEGLNLWPAVHRFDAARIFQLALENRAAEGPYHAVAEEGIPFKDIAALIGRRLGVPVVGLSDDEANAHFGWFAPFAGMDAPTSSERTRRLLGWEPREPGLLTDIDQPAYFDA